MSDPDGSFHFNLGPQFSEHIRNMASAARLSHELAEFARTQEVDTEDVHALRAHLVNGHDMHPDSTFFRDESQDSVPGISKVDWSKQYTMPPHSHADLHALHRHDHDVYGKEDDPYEDEDEGRVHRHL